MTPYDVPKSVRANQQTRALARRPQPCGGGIGRGLVCEQYPTVLYPCGWRCARCAQATGLVAVHGLDSAYGQQLRQDRADARATGHPNDNEEAATA